MAALRLHRKPIINSMRLAGLCVSILFCIATAPSQAQVYKWVDGQGKIHYTDAPPASPSAKAEVMKTAPVSGVGATTNTWEEKDRDFRRRKIEQAALQAQEKPQPTSQEICTYARYKLQMLDGRIVYRVNKEGERGYMEDAEREAIERKAKEDIARHCRS